MSWTHDKGVSSNVLISRYLVCIVSVALIGPFSSFFVVLDTRSSHWHKHHRDSRDSAGRIRGYTRACVRTCSRVRARHTSGFYRGSWGLTVRLPVIL